MPEVKSEQPDIAKGPDAGVEPEVDAPDEASVEPSSEELPEMVELDLGELQTQLREMTAKAESNWNEVLRARAEMDNLRKRHERELDGARKFALEGFVGELLQVRDSLELGVDAAQGEAADTRQLREGTELTLKLLGDVMSKFGVEQLNPDGEPFDPDYHQAMSIQPRDDVPPNTVVTVIQKGYTLNGRLVRPAMVMVSQSAEGGG